MFVKIKEIKIHHIFSAFFSKTILLLLLLGGIFEPLLAKTLTKKLPLFQDSLNLLYGIAGKQGKILNKKYFVINYNNQWKIPYWVAYKLDTLDLKGKIIRQGRFQPDSELPVGFRAEPIDYEHSGYDRGHMAPAGDFKRSPEAMKTTFLLSNIAPQTPALNRKIWKRLEEEVRKRVLIDGKLWIITGNLFIDSDSNSVTPYQHIGPNKVAVPTHCFKVILCCGKNQNRAMYGFMLPNQQAFIGGTPKDYILSIDRLEQITGYDFFPLLDDSLENRLESVKPKSWQN